MERLKAGGEEDDRRWDGWMASLTQRTWVWTSSGSWWWKGKPGVLQSMESQSVRYNWVAELKMRTELNKDLIEVKVKKKKIYFSSLFPFKSMNLSMIQTHRHTEQICHCQGKGDARGVDWEFRISRSKLLYIGWRNTRSYCIAQKTIFNTW